MRNRIAAAVVLLSGLGCAGVSGAKKTDTKSELAQADVPGAPAPEGRLVCTDDYPTGSHIPVRKCRYQEDIDNEALQTQVDYNSHPAQQVGTQSPGMPGPR